MYLRKDSSLNEECDKVVLSVHKYFSCYLHIKSVNFKMKVYVLRSFIMEIYAVILLIIVLLVLGIRSYFGKKYSAYEEIHCRNCPHIKDCGVRSQKNKE